eukprot:3026633-Rhodomonas_salina.1
MVLRCGGTDMAYGTVRVQYCDAEYSTAVLRDVPCAVRAQCMVRLAYGRATRSPVLIWLPAYAKSGTDIAYAAVPDERSVYGATRVLAQGRYEPAYAATRVLCNARY